MKSDYILITAQRLQDFAIAVLQAGGFTAQEAEQTARSLVLSNLLGYDSHGVIRVAEYLYFLKHGEVVSGAELKTEKETDATYLADAGRGLGQVQMPRLLDILITKAQKTGTASGALRDCGHAGRLGEWAEMIARAGYAGFVAVNDNGALRIVAPPGGREGRTSTNPVAFGIPLPDGEVFTLDMSTSATAVGKVRLAYVSGETVPPGQIQDIDGNPATDPAVMFEEPLGSLLPMGGVDGYKGFGLSMMVDCLVAGLSGGFTPPAPDGTPVINNVCAVLWAPQAYAGRDHMAAQAAKYLDFVRQTAPIDPARPVRLPGDRARAEKAKREKTGIPLSRGTCKTLAKSAQITGVKVPVEFPSD